MKLSPDEEELARSLARSDTFHGDQKLAAQVVATGHRADALLRRAFDESTHNQPFILSVMGDVEGESALLEQQVRTGATHNHREVAAWALTRRAGAGAVPTLLGALSDRDSGVRFSAMTALIAVGDVDSFQAVREFCPVELRRSRPPVADFGTSLTAAVLFLLTHSRDNADHRSDVDHFIATKWSRFTEDEQEYLSKLVAITEDSAQINEAVVDVLIAEITEHVLQDR